MKNRFVTVSTKVVSMLLLPLFLGSFLVVPPVSANPAQSIIPNVEKLHPLASVINREALQSFNTPTYRWIDHGVGGFTQATVDFRDPTILHQLQEVRDNQVLTIRYLYESYFKTVTLLLSITPRGEKINYTHYYRYLLGPDNALSLILEEGRIEGDLLLPCKLYDYYGDGLGVRFFDKEGKLLRIDNSDGFQKKFYYSQNGKLLTIQEIDPLGQVSFNDQITKNRHGITPEKPYLYLNELFSVLPSRDQGKRPSLTSFTNLISDQTFRNSPRSILLGESHQSFLTWLEAAYPTRAGPPTDLLNSLVLSKSKMRGQARGGLS